MHPWLSSTPKWKALIVCHLLNHETPVSTIECLNGMEQLTNNAILLQNPLKLERQSYFTFRRSTKHAKRSLSYFQDFSNTEKKLNTAMKFWSSNQRRKMIQTEEEKTRLHCMTFDRKTNIENVGKTLVVKAKKRKLGHLINKMFFVNTAV